MIDAGSPLEDWLKRIETYSPREIELGLDRMRLILERLGLRRPERVFHVAGTNGKGSSVALLQSHLSETGKSIGTYTSPHVHRYNERICIDGDPVSDRDIVAAFERIESLRDGVPLTYFEFGTFAALVVFEACAVDIVVLEVGMGGRLDAVNAVEPDGGLITNVSLDHCDWLGDDIETIAFEKAGILRADKPFVFASTDVPKSLQAHADAIGAELIVAGRDFSWSPRGGNAWSWNGRSRKLECLQRPSLKGDFQIDNAAAVLTLMEAAGFDELLQTAVVDRALRRPRLDGRMQTIDSDRYWILDVAHNPAAARVLASELRETSACTLAIVGMLDDKDVEGVIGALEDEVDFWIAVSVDSPRAIRVGELARRVANRAGGACLVVESIDMALTEARRMTTEKDRILITGSFYLVGPALRALEI